MLPDIVVGSGVVGLSVARALLHRKPDRTVVVLDKEPSVAAHQTGHNSGVIHSGLYYAPGSLKARLTVEGSRALKEYCTAHGVAFDVPGKLVVATSDRELVQLDRLFERGLANGVAVRRASIEEIREREPHLRVLAGLVVDSTGRVDYRQVAAAIAAEITRQGGEVRLGQLVESVSSDGGRTTVRTSGETLHAGRVVVCAGLQSDRLARASDLNPGVRILPFRGEYSELVPERAHLVKGLVYPVPDPDLPFLGVHLTRGIDGVVHIGPNAVPALAREGYSWRQFSARDVLESAIYPGSWRLARRYGGTGIREIARSLTGRSLVRAARPMLPELRSVDVRRSGSGVRAQAIARDGRLVDDFLFVRSGTVLHVLNAPSPAATACLPIGEHIVDRLNDDSG